MGRQMTDKTHASFMAKMKRDFARDRKRLAKAKKNKTGIFAEPKKKKPKSKTIKYLVY